MPQRGFRVPVGGAVMGSQGLMREQQQPGSLE